MSEWEMDALREYYLGELDEKDAEIERLKTELQNERIENGRLLLEVLDWKDRYAASQQALEATIKHCDDLLNEAPR